MLKKCITLEGKIINVGEWDLKIDKEGVEKNPIPKGAIEEEINISYTEDGRIVRIDDYYALRQAEYPKVGDQLDAIWKGLKSLNIQCEEFENMLNKIEDIKHKYPKH